MQPDAHTSPKELFILLLAAEPAAGFVRNTLAEQLGATVVAVQDPRSCQEHLERQEIDVLLLEEAFVLEDQVAADTLYGIAGEALVLEVNFGVADAQRIARQIRAALRRRSAEGKRARAAAAAAVRNDLSASIAGLLLESELALRKAGPDLAPHLQQLVTLAEAVSQQLRS